MEKEIRITNELDEITALAIFVEEFCSDLSLPAETTMHINLPTRWKSIMKSD